VTLGCGKPSNFTFLFTATVTGFLKSTIRSFRYSLMMPTFSAFTSIRLGPATAASTRSAFWKTFIWPPPLTISRCSFPGRSGW